MSLEYLKLCCDRSHLSGYSCARCNKTYCMTCDHASDVEMIKTIVRYCPDWRCQREKRIEEGELEVHERPGFPAAQEKALPMEPATHVLWHGRTLCDDLRLRSVPRDWPAGQRWLSLDAVIEQDDPPDRCKECWIKLDARFDEDIDMWNRAYAENYNAKESE